MSNNLTSTKAGDHASSEQNKKLTPDATAVKGALVTLKEEIEFVASSNDIYETLVDEGKIAAWSRAKVVLEKKVGGKFSLFDGNITGEFIELVSFIFPSSPFIPNWG